MPVGELSKGSQQFSLNLFNEAEQYPASTKVAPSTTVTANPPPQTAKPADLMKMFADPVSAKTTQAAQLALKKHQTLMKYNQS